MIADTLITAVRVAGAALRAEPPDLVLIHPERIPPELEEQLKRHKAEVLERLELEASLDRLEAAGIHIAIRADGTMRLVASEAEMHTAALDGLTIYSPRDAFMYLMLDERERCLLDSFKGIYGGRTEWL